MKIPAGLQGLGSPVTTVTSFPLVISAKEVDRYERVLNAGWDRMANAAGVERAANLVEIAKIANHRFDELVAGANPIAAARSGTDRSTSPAD